MLLSKETTVHVTEKQSNIIGHLGFAAYKLWNCMKYERDHWKELGLAEYPNWYYQKRVHRTDFWYKNLPSQTAQEVCKLLDKGYRSYFSLLKTGGIKSPHPPRYKHEPMTVTYMQNGIVHDGAVIRLSIPAQLKAHLAERFDIHENYLFIENMIFDDMENIKQVKLYMPERGTCRVIVIYEIPDPVMLPDNDRYMSIDIGIHNLITAYDSTSGRCMILGRRYSSILHRYDKLIAHYQGISDSQQNAAGVRYPKMSERVRSLYRKKNRSVHDLIHKCTRYIADYCHDHSINTVIIGDITGIRRGRDLGHVTNQKFHQLPYKQIYGLLKYKLTLYGISLVMQNEAYSSQTSPKAPEVSRKYACRSNRRYRGLYIDGTDIYNADAAGAYNILRLYSRESEKELTFPTAGLSAPKNVAV